MRYKNFALHHHLRDRVDITLSEKAVAFMLSTYRNSETGQCCPSQQLLAERSGVSRQHMNKIIKSLVEKKVLEVKKYRNSKLRRRTMNNYVFVFDKNGAK